MTFPCEHYLPAHDDVYFRAIDVQTPDYVLFRWLCQLKAAPYSYDWLDNFGRQSPPNLIPGMEQLDRGQRVMTIFTLADFAVNQHLTLVLTSPVAQQLFGQIALTYAVMPQSADACRLVVKFLIRYPPNLLGWFVRWGLPWGDVFMMRKQFRTLKHLAETHHRSAIHRPPEQ